MKRLKSSSHDLHELFTRNITVKEIAEPLASFDVETDASVVRQFMDAEDYDQIGVRRDGLVIGYARRIDLSPGTLGDYLVLFSPEDTIPVETPLLDSLEAVEAAGCIFVTSWGMASGIATHGDLQKAPVRMWLFGLISLVEMQMLRIIRAYYPGDSWQEMLKPNRVRKAREILADRQSRNAAIDLADCLQFCDKRDLVLGDETLLRRLRVADTAVTRSLLEHLEDLRNDLAHAQDILGSRRSSLLPLARQATELLQRWEDVRIGPGRRP
jgi:hypothetical protein